MCSTCGCNQPENTVTLTLLNDDVKKGENLQIHYHPDVPEGHMHEHHHDHDKKHHHKHHKHEHDHHKHHHDHEHKHHDRDLKEISVEQNILSKNQLLAERNRGFFEAKNVLALNIISSPGSGKTSLLEKTILAVKDKITLYVIEGDQQTLNDANRIKAAGAPVIQINTGNGCHLDSFMVSKAVKSLEVKDNSVLIIENVGNLVCPSLFDLGEKHRIVMMSVTEGDDKPIKYPTAFQHADVCIISKIDLLPYVDFDVEKAKQYASQINPGIRFFELSSKTSDGIDLWLDWLKNSL